MARLWSVEQHAPYELGRWRSVWEKTGNVAAAWRCFRLARAWGLPVPPSVLAEFDRIAADFEAEVDRVRINRAEASARGTPAGLKRETVARIVTRAGRGSNDPAADLVLWERDFELAGAVGILRHGGETEGSAVEQVARGTTGLVHTLCFDSNRVTMIAAKTPPVTVDVVRRAVRRVRRLTENGDG